MEENNLDYMIEDLINAYREHKFAKSGSRYASSSEIKGLMQLMQAQQLKCTNGVSEYIIKNYFS